MVLCQEKECIMTAVFGFKGGKIQFCNTHKSPAMTNLKSKRCEYEECEILPVYGFEGNKIQFCKRHSKDGMIDLKSKFCDEKGCSLRASYKNKSSKLMYCSKHKKEGMLQNTKRCESTGCIGTATYGQKGGIGKLCINHKEENMVCINLKYKYCEYPGCESTSSFGEKGGPRRFCVKHKMEGMIDVKNKRCEHEGCDSITPVFGEKGGKPRFCKSHKLEGMIDVKNKRCEYEDCISLSSSFDIKGGKGRFCAQHKTDEMIDVKLTPCDYPHCRTRVSYGKPGNPESKCSKHRLPGMIRRSNAKCKTPACKEIAIWGSNWIPKHCETHKLEDEHNLIENPCSSCGLMYILDKDQKCEMCNPISFATVRLAKQNALMNYLDAHGLKGSSTDTIIENGQCGKERPDRVFDFGDKIVILECDEHQHRDRACLCEQARMVNLGQSYGGIPVYFIRWNPDDYTPENSKKEPEALSKRHKLVCDLIINIEKGKYELPLALVSAFYMYYDEWSCLQDAKWEIITAFVS